MSEITSDLLKKLAPSTSKAKRDRFLPYFNSTLPKYGITTKKRVAAFLATVVMESDYLRATEEYADGWAYDISKNRKKAVGLGNTEVGDGPKYKGRTLIQTTGKKNYQRLSDILGVDFVKNPKQLAQPQYAVAGACVYWQDNKLNALSDAGNFFGVEGVVNRGDKSKRAKDYPKREALYNLILAELSNNFTLDEVAEEPEQPAPDPTKSDTDTKDDTTTDNNTGTSTKVDVSGGDVKIETNSNGQKEKVAIIATPKPNFFKRIYARLIAAVSGNVAFQWASDKIGTLTGITLSSTAWIIIIVTVLIFTLVWIGFEIWKWHKDVERTDKMNQLLLEQNSTPNNDIQLISQDDAPFFAAKGWRLINSGTAIPESAKEPQTGDSK